MRSVSSGASGRGQSTSASHPRRRSGALRIGGQRREVLLHRRVGLLARGLDHRLVEVAVADLAGEVGDDGSRRSVGRDQPVEHRAELVADVADQRLGALEAAVEDRGHGGRAIASARCCDRNSR